MGNTYKSAEELLQDNINNYIQAATFSQANIREELLQELQKYDFIGFLEIQIGKYSKYGTGKDIQTFLDNNAAVIKYFEIEVLSLKDKIALGDKDAARLFSKKRTDPSMRIFTL